MQTAWFCMSYCPSCKGLQQTSADAALWPKAEAGASLFASLACCLCHPCTVPGSAEIPQVTSNITGNVFFLNTSFVNQSVAQATCNANGGHLAAWSSQEEQAEVENFYLQGGWILPVFHSTYWMGMVSNNSAWPAFRYMDKALPCEPSWLP